MSTDNSLSVLLKVRVSRRDSVYVYALLEAHEGLTSYSTLDGPPGAEHRDLLLQVAPDFEGETRRLIQWMMEEGVQIHELPSD